MNKLQFIKILNEWLEENNVSPKECHVSHGGSLLLLGIRETTSDIDLTVSNEIWDRFKDIYEMKHYPACNGHPAVDTLIANEYIDLHLIREGDDRCLLEENNIQYRSAYVTLEDKLLLNRPKDQGDIELLRKFTAII